MPTSLPTHRLPRYGLGGLYAWLTNGADRAREGRFDRVSRERADGVGPRDGPADPRAPLAAPQARDRSERAALRRAARRRHVVRTVLVVGALLVLSLVWMWIRIQLRR